MGSDLFAFGIAYNDPQNGATPLYNGNIAETDWKTANDNGLRRYRYEYDALNRLELAAFNIGDNSQPHRYSTSNISYDKNGNILGLTRNGHTNSGATSFGTMDNLVYTYDSGNKLTKVLDNGNDNYGFVDGANTTTEYTYDDNGNMLTDANKGITSIAYNHLNLPTQISINGNGNTGTISYIYDATCMKLKKTVGSSVTDYAGNFIYQNGSLQFFSHPEGYVTPNGQSGYDYVYQYKDHLGNVRLSYLDNNGTPEIVEENNYYPFGLKHKGYNTAVSPLGNSLANKWKYNGKELDESLGLNMYDYGARRYMKDIGRWTTIDPASSEYVGISHYSYVANNPNVFIDPDGRRLFFVGGANNDQDGWEYITRWGNFMTDAGIRNFVRINASNGKEGDIAFTNNYRSSGTYFESVWKKDPGGGSYREYTGRELPQEHIAIDRAVEQIKSNIEENPLEEGEQFNLAGYSYGSVLQAQAALRLANDGQYIDNLILIGSPISDDSKLMKQLKNNDNIGNVLRVDIEGDLLSNPKDVLRYILGGVQNRDAPNNGTGPHFDLARPDDEADQLIQTVVQWLQKQGVE